MYSKKIILKPEDKEDEPPLGLRIAGRFKRLGILNPAVIQRDSEVDLLSRLIYQDSYGLNSCIVKHQGVLEGEEVRIKKDKNEFPLEKLVFQPIGPHGKRGVEDFRTSCVEGETPLHGFLVHYNGPENGDARTEYLRTKETNPENLSGWDRFGIYFPNIGLEEAIETVSSKDYKQRWIKQKNKRNIKLHTETYPPSSPFLSTKDCCLWPKKIKKNGEEYYGVIAKLEPYMNLLLIKDFKELAKYEFWQDAVRDIEESILLKVENNWETHHLALASPPFEIDEGMLVPYHGVVMEPERNYKFGFALTDPDNPQKILARTKSPFLYATEPWESNGVVSGKVVFPTGHAIKDGIVHLFYGAGDKYIAHASTTKQKILDSLS